MATADVHRSYNKNARMPKKGSSTDETSETKSPEKLQLLFERLEQVLSLVEPAKEEIVDLHNRISYNQETTQDNFHSQLLEAKQENEKLLHDVMEMRKDKTELQRANVKLQALEKEQERKENVYTEKINAFKDVTQKTEERLQKALKDLEETKRLSAQQETELRTKLDIQSQEKARLLATNQNLKAERDKLETDLSNIKTRLSKLMSDKLSDNNPDIADLSDENRPTKIAEKYQELYDNQWTDAYEVAQTYFTDSDEKTLTRVLRIILKDIHEFCEKEFSEQENALLQALYRTDKIVKDQPPLAIKTQLKDLKRRVAKDGIENITQKFLESAYKSTRFENFILEVKDFVHECVKICWLMVLQDPPLAFHDVRKGEVFDSNRFKAFTVTGPLIDFIVWPPLLLQKDGHVLSKGIVQCKKQFNGSKSVRTRSRQVSASAMGISTGSVRLPVKDSKIDTTKWLPDQQDRNNRIHESFEEKNNTMMSDKKSNDSVTATTERPKDNQDVQTNVGYQKNGELTFTGGAQSDSFVHNQSRAANVPRNQANPHPQPSTQPVQREKSEAHMQSVSNQNSDPQHQLQNTNVAPSQYNVFQQNQHTQSDGQPTTTQSTTNESMSSAQHSRPSTVQQPTFSPGNNFRGQQHFYPVSFSEYPQHLMPTQAEWNSFIWCMHNMSEANARHNLGALYDKCKKYNDWRMFMAHNEFNV